ncbi:MAG: polysaccharide biosynthesis tyrosine autokinase [Acidobacteriaceae bacterium]
MGPQKTHSPPAMGTPDPQQVVIGSEVRDTSLSEAVATLRKRQWVLIVAAVLGVVYGAYKAYTQPRVFEASSIIQVHNGSSNEYKLDASYDFSDDSQTKMNTEVLILQSDSLLQSVAADLNLANNPDFLGANGPTPTQSLDNPTVHQSVIGTLKSSLSVSLIPRTELIRITYSSLSPKLSADIVNQLVTDYIHRSYKTPEDRTQKVYESLADNLDKLKSEAGAAQEEMMQLQRKLGVLGYDSEHNQLQSSLEGLLTAEETARIARINAESRYRMVAGMDPNTIDDSIETTPGTAPGELNILRGQLAVARATYSQLTAPGGLGPNHPRARELQADIDTLTKQITAEQSRLESQAKETFLAAKAAEDKTEQELDARKKEAYDQGDDLVRFTLQQRQYEQKRALYDGLEQRLQTAKIESGLDANEVDQVDQALPPANPTLRPKQTIILTTTLFFLLGGVVIAFLLESLDTGLQNIQEIEELMMMPSLAIVPRAKRTPAEQVAAMSTAQRNVNVLTQPKSQFTEAFRSLRTSLLLSTAGHPPKFILFTSATPSEGKTTTASNLACILAQGATRVLLIDADLRRPNVHHRFGLTGKLGLTTVLAGTSTLQEALQTVPEIPNLDILPSGPVPPFPSEMLSSEAMRALLERLAEQYSHIVIDSPPILSVTDGVILGRVVDAVVLVIRHGKSNKNVMRRARDLLARSGAPVAGLVLNAVDLNSPEYYGYYGYSGYSYGNVDADSWETQHGPAVKTGPQGGSRS